MRVNPNKEGISLELGGAIFGGERLCPNTVVWRAVVGTITVIACQ